MKMLSDMMHRKSDLSIAPLIDVVFLLLIYFMVTATLVKKEADLGFFLPVTNVELTGHPIEVLVEISEPGEILVEGIAFDDTNDLVRQLASLKVSADSSCSELIVSIMPAEKATHGRIIAVMDACAAARVKNMSFCM